MTFRGPSDLNDSEESLLLERTAKKKDSSSLRSSE